MSQMTKELINKGKTMDEYLVYGDNIDLEDIDLINFCDDGNFGGRVTRISPDEARVLVYID